MNIAVRPHTRLAAAALVAGMVGTVPALVTPGHELSAASRSIHIRPVSVITDALYGFGDVVSSAAEAGALSIDLVASLPVNALYTAAAALQDPSAVASLLSYVAQLYLNPGDTYPYVTYPWTFKSDVIQPLTNLLPSLLGTGIDVVLSLVGLVINAAFSLLPDPAAGSVLLAEVPFESAVGSALFAGQRGISLAGYVVAGIVRYLGYLPARVESSIEAAIKSADIPGAVGNLVNGLMHPAAAAAAAAATGDVSTPPRAATVAITLDMPAVKAPPTKVTGPQADVMAAEDVLDVNDLQTQTGVVADGPIAQATQIADGSKSGTSADDGGYADAGRTARFTSDLGKGSLSEVEGHPHHFNTPGRMAAELLGADKSAAEPARQRVRVPDRKMPRASKRPAV